MRVLIFKEIDTADHGVGGFRIGAVDIPDTTAAAAVPDTAMRMFQQQAGGSIADGVYWPIKASESFRSSGRAGSPPRPTSHDAGPAVHVRREGQLQD
jgi:hypothetical protein